MKYVYEETVIVLVPFTTGGAVAADGTAAGTYIRKTGESLAEGVFDEGDYHLSRRLLFCEQVVKQYLGIHKEEQNFEEAMK